LNISFFLHFLVFHFVLTELGSYIFEETLWISFPIPTDYTPVRKQLPNSWVSRVVLNLTIYAARGSSKWKNKAITQDSYGLKIAVAGKYSIHTTVVLWFSNGGEETHTLEIEHQRIFTAPRTTCATQMRLEILQFHNDSSSRLQVKFLFSPRLFNRVHPNTLARCEASLSFHFRKWSVFTFMLHGHNYDRWFFSGSYLYPQ